MIDQIQGKIFSIIPNLHPWVFVLITILISLYVFWKLCSRTRKNNSSIFDSFFVGGFLSLILGRIAYIISNYSDFSKYIWYWLPYEKYGDEIFLFRVLPWRFLKVWDLGLELSFIFLGFVIGCTIWILLAKKWRWSHLYVAIYASGFTLLLFSVISIGKLSGNILWVSYGVLMLTLFLAWSILRSILIRIIIGIKEMKILLVLDSIFITLASVLIIRVFMLSSLSLVEKVGLISILIWTILGLLYHILDTTKATVTIEKVSSVRQVSINDIKQQIRLPR